MILGDIPCPLDPEKLAPALHVEREGEDYADLRRLAEQAAAVVRPKALVRKVAAGCGDAGEIFLDDVTFHSGLLWLRLKDLDRAFAFIATCGTELDEQIQTGDNFLWDYWRDEIKQAALNAAAARLRAHLKSHYGLKNICSMNPGSADREVWPLEQQKQLFSLFGDVERLIGVTLTRECLMIPNKTVSGVFFESESSHVNCAVCARAECPSRSAPHDPSILASLRHR